MRKHPNVFMPDEKEPAFFNAEYHQFRSEVRDSWHQYVSRFQGGEQCAAVGEATPGYSLVRIAPGTPARIAESLPEARLIYIVRHPLRRIESAWRQNVHMGRLPANTFKDALWKYTPIVSGSKYYETLRAYREHFADDQIYICFLKDLSEHPAETLNRCFRFLGVEPIAEQLERSAPQNDSEESRYVHPLLDRLRRQKGLWDIGKRLLPDTAKAFFTDLFLQPLPDPDWDEQSLSWAVEQVREDARKTLTYAEKPSDFWQFPGGYAE
jgi:hypothetical protein